MEHIKQLKQIRTDAIARIRNSADFKLASKLGVLIVDLGEQLDDRLDGKGELLDAIARAPVSAESSSTKKAPATDAVKSDAEKSDPENKMIDALVAEMESDVAKLDEAAKTETPKISPFGKPNGSAGPDHKRGNAVA